MVVFMRAYIFTDLERKLIVEWLKTGERNKNNTLNRVISRIGENRHTLLADVKILLAAVEKFDAGY